MKLSKKSKDTVVKVAEKIIKFSLFLLSLAVIYYVSKGIIDKALICSVPLLFSASLGVFK